MTVHFLFMCSSRPPHSSYTGGVYRDILRAARDIDRCLLGLYIWFLLVGSLSLHHSSHREHCDVAEHGNALARVCGCYCCGWMSGTEDPADGTKHHISSTLGQCVAMHMGEPYRPANGCCAIVTGSWDPPCLGHTWCAGTVTVSIRPRITRCRQLRRNRDTYPPSRMPSPSNIKYRRILTFETQTASSAHRGNAVFGGWMQGVSLEYAVH
jgi:hypothetical protein